MVAALRSVAAVMFAGAVIGGTLLDVRARNALAPRAGPLLVADLHVHPYPGDGSLTVWQLQREAARRGVDVIAITSHNHRAGLDLARVFGTDPDGAIVLPGQEVTAADFHMIAAGTEQLIDWTLPAIDAVGAIQRQGGVAIAAHPVDLINAGWESAARGALDGAEVMHPLRFGSVEGGRELDAFFDGIRAVNPSAAAIGSTDFHMMAPLGLCRTYILARERTAAAAMNAIRTGETAAACGDGELVGAPEHIAAIRREIPRIPPGVPPSPLERFLAVAALAALAMLAIPLRR